MSQIASIFKGRPYLFGFVILGLIGAGVFMRTKSQRTTLGTYTEPLRKGAIVESVYGIGTVTATRSFQLKSGVTSSIAELFVKEGDQVKRGMPLVRLEGTTTIRAPFDGTVTSLPFKVGESVFSQTIILNLVDLSDRYILVSLEQQGVIRVRHGQKAKLSFEGMRSTSFDGRVESVYSNDTNFLVRITVANLPKEILPGMTSDVAIGIQERQDVLVVPVAAVLGGKVTVKRGEGSPFAVEIKTGIIDGASAEVLSGDVQAGDQLLIRDKVSL